MPDLLTKLLAEWRMIANAPQSFVIALLLGFAVIWLLMEWQYRTIIRRKQSYIDLLKTQDSQAPSIINRLSSLIFVGENIQRTFIQGGDTAQMKQQFSEWTERTETLLKQELGAIYMTRFRAAKGNPMMGSPHGRSIEGDDIWQTIGGKIMVLEAFIIELSGGR